MIPSDNKSSSVQAKRAQFQADADAIGVTEEFIGRVVDVFYEKIRRDDTLAPIFVANVEDRWDSHLEKMKLFWSSVARTSGAYSGKPFQVHVDIKEIEASQFVQWLNLFDETLDEISPTPEAKEHMSSRAQRIARSLRMGVEMRDGALV